MTSIKRGLYGLISLLFVVSLTLNTKPVEAAATNGRIVYTAVSEGNTNIYTINPDGSGSTKLNDSENVFVGASFSPDGSKIVYSQIEAESYYVSIMKSDGTNKNLTSQSGAFVGWLPDSSRVNYYDLNDFSVRTMNSFGSDVLSTGIIPGEIDGLIGGSVDWSPDNSRIAYPVKDGDYIRIYTRSINGTDSSPLTRDDINGFAPQYSPGGEKIYFVGTEGEGSVNSLYSVSANGDNELKIVDLPASDPGVIELSPDGTKVFYLIQSEESGVDLYTMNIDGSNQIKALDDIYSGDDNIASGGLSWSPDSTKITYAVREGDSSDIFIINYDGSNRTNITNTPDIDERIAFTRQAWGATPQTNSGGGSSSAPDNDNDGIPDSVEDKAPNGGDANNDEIKDSEQAYVTSLIDPVSGNYAALAVSEQCSIDSVSIDSELSNTATDDNFDYPNGLMDFNLACGEEGFTANIEQYYYNQNNQELVLRKYNPATKTYTNIDQSSVETQTIAGHTVAKASYQVTDGGELDLDNQVDGNIKDPSGLGSPISTLANTGTNTNALATTALLLTLTGGLIISTRKYSFVKFR